MFEIYYTVVQDDTRLGRVGYADLPSFLHLHPCVHLPSLLPGSLPFSVCSLLLCWTEYDVGSGRIPNNGPGSFRYTLCT